MGGKKGIIDKQGKYVAAAIYDTVFYDDGIIWAGMIYNERGDHKLGTIDRQSGEMVTPHKYTARWGISDGVVCVEDEHDKWGYLDSTGKEIISPSYNEAYSFRSGVAYAGRRLLKLVHPPVAARPGKAAINVYGKDFVFGVYNIGGTDYYKVNDLLYALKGTQADLSKEIINGEMFLVKGGVYAPGGDEMASVGNKEKQAQPLWLTAIVQDGGYKYNELQAYNIEDYNYVKFDDFADMLGLKYRDDKIFKTFEVW